MKVYIAGPMRGLPSNNFPAFYAVEQCLRDTYPDAEIVNPARMDAADGFDGSHEADNEFMREAMRRDTEAVCGCTHIVLLPGWRDSEGAGVEASLADMLGLTRLYAADVSDDPLAPSSGWITLNSDPESLTKHLVPPRKRFPVASGVLGYFPDAIRSIAHCSWVGNEQHNPGEPLHWSRDKSSDHADCMMRHFMERGTVDEDGVRHMTKAAWRALALLQLEVEDAK